MLAAIVHDSCVHKFVVRIGWLWWLSVFFPVVPKEGYVYWFFSKIFEMLDYEHSRCP